MSAPKQGTSTEITEAIEEAAKRFEDIARELRAGLWPEYDIDECYDRTKNSTIVIIRLKRSVVL